MRIISSGHDSPEASKTRENPRRPQKKGLVSRWTARESAHLSLDRNRIAVFRRCAAHSGDAARQPAGSRRSWPHQPSAPRGFPADPFSAKGEFGIRDTTRQYKTHNAEPREVQYPWHPWFGRTVCVYRIVVRGTRSRAHCGLDQVQCARSLEIPLWMLEAASCSTLRLAENPIVDCTALQRLKALLHGGVLEDRHSSLGGADADPQDSTPRSTVGVVSPPVGGDRLAQITARDSAKDDEVVSEAASRTLGNTAAS